MKVEEGIGMMEYWNNGTKSQIPKEKNMENLPGSEQSEDLAELCAGKPVCPVK